MFYYCLQPSQIAQEGLVLSEISRINGFVDKIILSSTSRIKLGSTDVFGLARGVVILKIATP